MHLPQRFTPTRRQLLKATGLTAGAVVAGQALASPAQASTRRLHDDTEKKGAAGRLYTGTPPGLGNGRTADSAYLRGPGLISAYAGGL